MNFFLDENFPKSAVAILSTSGHEAFDLRGTPREGIPDFEIFAEAQKLGAVFLTTDRDFFHTIPHLYERHAGVIMIALRQPNRESILNKLLWAINTIRAADFANRTFQLRDNNWIAVPPLVPT